MMKKSLLAQPTGLLTDSLNRNTEATNNFFNTAALWQLLLLGFLFFAFAFSAQAQYDPIVTSGSNGCSITGTFNYNSILNGKPKYTLGSNKIEWVENKWTVSHPSYPYPGGVLFENTQNTPLPPCSGWVNAGCGGGTFSIASGCQPPCVFVPTNISVTYIGGGNFGFAGPSFAPIVYTPSGTQNGAPKWVNAFDYDIRWTGSQWAIYHFNIVVAATNNTGSITNLPCTGWAVNPDYANGIVLSGGCGSLLPPTVTPSVSIASDDADNSITAGTSVTFTATPTNGGTTPAYQWKKNTVDVGTNSNTYMDNALADGDMITVEMTSNDPCASPATATSNTIEMAVAAPCAPTPDDIIITGFVIPYAQTNGTYSSNGSLNGTAKWEKLPFSISWSGTQWEIILSNSGGVFILSFNTTGSINNIPCSGWATTSYGNPGTLSGGCGIIPPIVDVTPSVNIVADPGSSIAPGTPVTFTATPTNGGTTPAYQWKKNTVDVGTNSNTYMDNALADGDMITVEMTSNDPCANPTTATSNTITMAVTNPCISPIRYVKAVATGNGSGEDWDNASDDLQAMIDIDCATQVWVAAGTYKPAAYPTGCSGCSTSRDYAFILRSGVKVYGGFAGTETALTERTSGNETILSGDIDNDNTLNNGNTYHVVLSINDNDQTLLDGCTVTGGNANGLNFVSIDGLSVSNDVAGGLVADNSYTLFTNNKFTNNLGYYGGGAYIEDGSAYFENCRFEGNLSDSGYGVGLYTYYAEILIDNCHFENNQNTDAYGGGCYVYYGSGTVKNSTFVNNDAYYGGGLYSYDASLTMENCLFDDNGNTSDTYYGGGLYNYSEECIVKNCTFVNNEASYGGAIYEAGYGAVTIEDCTFTENTAEYEGGAMYLYYPAYYYGPMVVSNCTFTGNKGTDVDSEGGAIYSYYGNYSEEGLIFQQCTFIENEAGFGGAISTYDYALTVENCLFAKNTATATDNDYGGGGAIYSEAEEITITNCTFAENTSTVLSGGGIAFGYGEGTVTNCILWGNTHADANPATAQIFNYDGSSDVTISHSTIQDGMPDDVTDGGDNIFADPLFTDAANNDYTLTACSPAINAGNNTGVSDTDLDGNDRIQEGTVDMGAYESSLPPPVAELPVVTAPTPACPNTPVSLVATTSVGSINWYDAPTDGNLLGNSASGQPFVVTPNGPTTYYAQIYTDAPNACVSTDRTAVLVQVVASAPLSISGNTNVCTGGSIGLIATGGNQYQWSGPNGFTSSGSSITRNNANTTMSGTYTVTITNNNCVYTLSTVVTVHPIPSATLSGNTAYCAGSTISLSAPMGATNYVWSGPGGFTQSGAGNSIARPNATTTMGGLYKVTVTNAGGCTASASRNITVTAGGLRFIHKFSRKLQINQHHNNGYNNSNFLPNLSGKY